MKKRLIAYFIFFPLIFLAALTDVSVYIKYIAYASIPVSIGAIIYAFIKTKAFYNAKKVIIFLLLAFTLAMPFVRSASSQYTWAVVDMQQEQAKKSDREKMDEAAKVLAEIGRIPKEERTPEQQRKYEQAKKDYEDAQKALGIMPCPTSQELYDEMLNGCWACDIADLFMEAGDKVASGFYKLNKEKGYALSLLIIGFMFWLISHVFKLLMSFGVGDIGAFFTELFKKMLLVGAISIILMLPMQKVVNFTITPFFLLSSSITGEIAKSANPRMASVAPQKIDQTMKKAFNEEVKCPYCEALQDGRTIMPDRKISEAIRYSASQDERVVSPLMRNAFLCTVCTIYKITVPPAVTGQFLYCKSKQNTASGADVGKNTQMYNDWDGWLVGGMLTLSFFLMSALFSFYLIDTFFRICFTLVLLPFLIVAWAFKSTKQYTMKGFEVLIHSAATYIIVALFMTLTILIFYAMLGPDASRLTELTNANNYNELVKLVGFRTEAGNGGRIMLSCLALMLIIFMMLKRLDGYITELTGINLDNQGGFKAASDVKTTIKAVGKTVSNIYDEAGKDGNAANAVGGSAGDKAAAIRQWGEDTSKADKAEQKNEQGAKETENSIKESGKNAGEKIEKGGDALAQKLQSKAAASSSTGIGIIAGAALLATAAVVKGSSKAAAGTVRTLSKVVGKAAGAAKKYGGRVVIRTAAKLNPAKAIARNKYFNKTVGLIWQTGENIKNAPGKVQANYNRYKTNVKVGARNTKAAYLRAKRKIDRKLGSKGKYRS